MLRENLFMTLRAQESESARRDTSRTFHPFPNVYPYRGTVAGGLSSWTLFADKANLGCNVQGARRKSFSLTAEESKFDCPRDSSTSASPVGRKVRNKKGGAFLVGTR
jgi:hypothetical protein